MTNPDSLQAICAELRATGQSESIAGRDADYLIGIIDRLERLDAEMRKRIEKYRDRLEVTGHYVMDASTEQLVRVTNPPDVDEKFDGIYCRDTTIQCLEEDRADLRARLAACENRKPDGYAYRYHSNLGDNTTVILFNSGGDVNGGKPIEAIPYFYAATPTAHPDVSVNQ